MSTADSPQQAIHTLYSDHHGWLHDWLRRQLGCSQSAADLAHDTFVRVLLRREAPSLREPRAYLGVIARGLLVDHWRRRALEQAWLQSVAALPESLLPSEEERHLAFEMLLRVDAMLDGLRPCVRSAFLLAQLDGIGYDEIATRLGVTRRSVERYVAEALLHCYALRHDD